ncbi:MAG: 30S ribosomal protein S16 [Saprospiraceae bacterium]|nr:30S ribosomal protein S16 [Saprospiraceae bacterium]
MPVKLRLSRKGRKKAPFYHIVVADARSPRDGKFIEKIGSYNPMTKPATIEIDRDKAFDWLTKGAQPTDTVRAILRFKGVYYKKHLMRGLKKGALTADQVDTMWTQWIESKDAKIATRIEQTKADLEAFRKAVSGSAKVNKPVADEESKLAAQAFRETEADETVNETPVVETTSEEVTEVISEVAEVAAEEPIVPKDDVVEAVADVAVEEPIVPAEDVVEAVAEETVAVVDEVAEVVQDVVAEEKVEESTEEASEEEEK